MDKGEWTRENGQGRMDKGEWTRENGQLRMDKEVEQGMLNRE